MNPRLALYRLQSRHGLSGPSAAALWRMAGLEDEPAHAANWLQRGVAVLAATLLGLGLILWIAANWQMMPRGMRFGFLQALIFITALAAVFRPAVSKPSLLLGFLLQGGLLAFFGQTYQTGADPWQLFAAWAVLALPWMLVARSDVLWTPWVLIVMTAVSLWAFSVGVRMWHFDESGAALRFAGWVMAIGVVALLAPSPWRRWLGNGNWAFRLAALLACLQVLGGALDALFFSSQVHFLYVGGLLVLGGAAAVLVARRIRDALVLSVIALAIDTLLVCGLGRWLFAGYSPGSEIGKLFLIGVAAAALVALSVSQVLRVCRHVETSGESA